MRRTHSRHWPTIRRPAPRRRAPRPSGTSERLCQSRNRSALYRLSPRRSLARQCVRRSAQLAAAAAASVSIRWKLAPIAPRLCPNCACARLARRTNRCACLRRSPIRIATAREAGRRCSSKLGFAGGSTGWSLRTRSSASSACDANERRATPSSPTGCSRCSSNGNAPSRKARTRRSIPTRAPRPQCGQSSPKLRSIC